MSYNQRECQHFFTDDSVSVDEKGMHNTCQKCGAIQEASND